MTTENRINRRLVLHFPGFEPLDARDHRDRYERTARKAAGLWDFAVTVGPIEPAGAHGQFMVRAAGDDWSTESRIVCLDHNTLVSRLNGGNSLQRLWRGFVSAGRIIAQGGAFGYFRHAWRFGLFFVFPFLLVALALVATGVIAALPALLDLPLSALLISLPLAMLFFFRLFLPWSDRLHTLHLFADWQMAVAMARLDDPAVTRWLDDCAAAARAALDVGADEILITSHSMGSVVATQVIGLLLEREPDLFHGRRVTFVTLAGAILQSALLRPADQLRARVGRIARTGEIAFVEVHCLTDAIHFYKSRVVAACGHGDAPQARLRLIRIRQMLDPDRYRRIKRDFLRVHRQYVLDADRRTDYDFTLLTAGPRPADAYLDDGRG